jgi:hypothetical protein
MVRSVSGSNGVQLDYIQVSPGSGTITTYEAAASGNTVAGSAVRETNSTAPGGTDVGFVGQGSANYVQFNNVSVPTAGLYRMLVTYANDEVYNGSQGGPVFRFAQISVNGGTASTVYFNNTFSWSNRNTGDRRQSERGEQHDTLLQQHDQPHPYYRLGMDSSLSKHPDCISLIESTGTRID